MPRPRRVALHPRRTLADVAAPGRARREPEAGPDHHRADQSPATTSTTGGKRYVISMAIRTLCFVGAVVVGDNWVRWVLVAGAFILPYVAVVMANSASPRIEGADLVQPNQGYKELE